MESMPVITTRSMTWEEQVHWVLRNTNVELENLYIVEEIAKDTTPNTVVTTTAKGSTVITYEKC